MAAADKRAVFQKKGSLLDQPGAGLLTASTCFTKRMFLTRGSSSRKPITDESSARWVTETGGDASTFHDHRFIGGGHRAIDPGERPAVESVVERRRDARTVLLEPGVRRAFIGDVQQVLSRRNVPQLDSMEARGDQRLPWWIEVEMSHLGDLQLDGLVREKRLDLILRSRAPLPEFMRRDITQIFHDANEITGNHGKIGFQSSLEWKAMPIEAPQAATDAGVVV